MAFSKTKRGAKKGERRGGRKKGTPNKVTSCMKQAVVAAFDEMGGVDGLAKWAKLNKTAFYTKIVPKLIPLTIGGTNDDGSIKIVIAPEEAGV